MNTVPKKILIVTGIYPPDIGGPATHLSQCVPFFIQQGTEVFVVTFGDTHESIDTQGARVFCVLRSRNVVARLVTFFRTVWRVAKGVDGMYIHDMSLAGLVAYALSIFRRIPYVLRLGGDFVWEQAYEKGATNRDYISFQGHEPFPYSLRRMLGTMIARRARAVVVPSEFLASVVKRWGVASDAIRVVPNAISEDTQQGATPSVDARITEAKKGGKKILVSSGRFVNWKRFDLLIQAMRNAHDTCLFLYGAGPEEKHLKNLVRELNLGERVFIESPRSRGELFEFYRHADAFVLLSSGETFSFAALEAYLAGTPLVLADMPALNEVFGSVGRKGVLFLSDVEPESIARTLRDEQTYLRPSREDIEGMRTQYSLKKHLDNIWGIMSDYFRYES